MEKNPKAEYTSTKKRTLKSFLTIKVLWFKHNITGIYLAIDFKNNVHFVKSWQKNSINVTTCMKNKTTKITSNITSQRNKYLVK